MLRLGLLGDAGGLDVGGVVEALARPRIAEVVWFTLWSATLGTVGSLLLGVPLAHLLFRRRFPGRTLLRGIVVAPFVLPTVVVGIAFRRLFTGPLDWTGLDGSAVGIVLALVFFNVAVVVRTVGSFWEGLDPRPAQAAASLGASPWRVARTVTLPALMPVLISAASVVFLFCATAFGVVLTLGGLQYANVETQIYLLTTQFLDLQGAAALSLLQVAVVALLLGLTRVGRRRTETGLARGAGGPAPRLGRTDAPVLALAAVVLVLVLAPVAALMLGSVRSGGEWTLAGWERLLGLGAAADAASGTVVPGSGGSAYEAVGLSLRVAVDATLLALTLGVLVSWLVARGPGAAGPGAAGSATSGGVRRRVVKALDGLVMLPLGVSAVTIGFGFLVTMGRPPLDLRDSLVLVPIAQALVALPLVVRTLVPVLRSVETRQREAAASLGAPPWRVAMTVDLPLAWRGLLASAGFAFAVSLGEFGATAFLAGSDRPTLPVLVYRLLGRPGEDNLTTALAGSVLLAVLCAGTMLLVERWQVRSVGAL
ncbi:iron ABC transporter permease [Nocardioidaceae bacterium]|nr:iron ABC transporter permease [Nocardioidaceae bacterium]